MKQKLQSSFNSIFYEKLKEAELRPDKSYFIYISPYNSWMEIESISDLSEKHLTFTYTGTMDGEPFLFEETIKLDNIKSFRSGIKLPDTSHEARIQLDNLYTIQETEENASTNQDDSICDS